MTDYEDTYFTISRCRSCGGSDLCDVLNLGRIPLANAFLETEKEARDAMAFPLHLIRCAGCGLVQLRETVSPDILFDSYAYFSSSSAPLARHFEVMAKDLIERYQLTAEDLVMEVGSNDGVFLRHFLNKTRVLGCDPATNVIEKARELGIPVLARQFDSNAAEEGVKHHGPARLIFASNVVGHIHGLGAFMQGVDEMLSADGVLVMEVHHLLDLINRSCFDQVYHEHLSFFSLSAMEHFLGIHGFAVTDARISEIHGGLLQVHAVREERAGQVSDAVRIIREQEASAGLQRAETYQAFSERVEFICRTLRDWVESHLSERIVGYGACAKGNVLLNACGLSWDHLECIVDSTPYKQGRFAPGTGLPVVSREMLDQNPPDWILLLAWNYQHFILDAESELKVRGVRFLLPIPSVSEI